MLTILNRIEILFKFSSLRVSKLFSAGKKRFLFENTPFKVFRTANGEFFSITLPPPFALHIPNFLIPF